jgi:hypothetical protein
MTCPRLVLELEQLAPRGYLAAGDSANHLVEHGDLEIELIVRVRRRPQADEVAVHRTAAIEHGSQLEGARASDHVGHGCQVWKHPKSRRWSSGGRCAGKVVAAVVSKTYSGATSFRFVCGHHRKNHGVDESAILAVVELPPRLLDPLRREYEDWQRLRETERAARERAGLCRYCGEVDDDGSCRWHELPRTVPTGR